MSTECERVFFAAKKTITPERNALSDKIIEACECLKAWWRNKVISEAIEPKASGPKRKAAVMKEEDEVLA
jgi:hAT family C-terminal dimerisation region